MPGRRPDGICLDADGGGLVRRRAQPHCGRVREGGEVLDRVGLDRRRVRLRLAGDGTLYTVTADYSNPRMFTTRTGRLFAASVPGAAR